MKKINTPQLTHYERVLSNVQDLRNCKRWAKIALKTANPSQAFFNLAAQSIENAPNNQVAKQIAQHYATEAIGYLHALVIEWAQQYNCEYHRLTEEVPYFSEFLIAMLGEDQVSINIGGQMAYQMACHEIYGKRVYLVTRELAELLLHTELKGLVTEDLRLPERSIYIQVPPDTNLRVHNVETGWHKLVGIYITEDIVNYSNVRCWRFLAVGQEKEPTDKYMSNDALVFWRVDLPKDTKLNTVLKQANQHMRVDTVEYDSPFKSMWDEWIIIFRFAMNVIIYATWPDCKRENIMANPEARKLWARVQKHPFKSSKRSKAQLAFSKEIPMRRTVLDRPTIINRSIEDTSSEGGGFGQPLLTRVRVHGHWKRQAVGKGRSERKLIWIEPHWRGPLDGEISNKIHKLK